MWHGEYLSLEVNYGPHWRRAASGQDVQGEDVGLHLVGTGLSRSYILQAFVFEQQMAELVDRDERECLIAERQAELVDLLVQLIFYNIL